jgi:pimeloyl-ACP methyl ester carboxylesterase
MPMFKRADAEIHYEVYGSGFPLLLYAPGGLKSQMEMWGGTSAAYPNGFPWMDPRKALSDKFTVVAMDQRNAGKSVADVKPDHGWHTFAGDHFALMDHLGFDKFHVMGGCIGGSYCFEAIEHDPERVAAAVVQNPIGLWEKPRHLGCGDQGLQRNGAQPRSVDQRGDHPVVRPQHVRQRLRVLGDA